MARVNVQGPIVGDRSELYCKEGVKECTYFAPSEMRCLYKHMELPTKRGFRVSVDFCPFALEALFPRSKP